MDAIRNSFNATVNKIRNNKSESLFSCLLIVYIITAILLFRYDPHQVVSNNGGLSIFISLIGGFLILMILFFIRRRKALGGDTSGEAPYMSTFQFFTKLLSVMMTIGVLVGLIYGGIYVFSNFTATSQGIIMMMLNFAIVAVILALIVSYFKIGKVPNDKPSFGRLAKNSLLYIPCLILDLVDYLTLQYKITPKPIWILLGVEAVLIALKFLVPIIFEKLITHNGSMLLKDPIYLNNETKLGTFQELNKTSAAHNLDEDVKYNYHYGLSSWVYINPQPSSTSSAYEDYTSILNLGNKPNILYNGRTNTLMVKMTVSPGEEKILYKKKNIKYQKWNNIVINYDGGTLDIFINNELVASVPGAIPYMSFDNITSGASPGIHGGICNVVYFNNTLSRSKISWLYNSTKNLNPPVL